MDYQRQSRKIEGCQNQGQEANRPVSGSLLGACVVVGRVKRDLPIFTVTVL